MAAATKKARNSGRAARGAGGMSRSAVMEFLIFEDNGGRYRWTLVADRSESLAWSGSFASYDDAKQAACVVRDGAGSARVERRAAGDLPVDLVVRRDAAPARDDLDAERWLDEGGSFSSEAVATWPAER